MTLEENKSIVQAVYPNCRCHVRDDDDEEWFLLFGEEVQEYTIPCKPIEYSFISEEHMWHRAARAILLNMIQKLENA